MELFRSYSQNSCCVVANKIHSMFLSRLISFQLHQSLFDLKSMMDLCKAETLSDFEVKLLNLLFFNNFLKNASSKESLMHPLIS
jgi:hypothetical protein